LPLENTPIYKGVKFMPKIIVLLILLNLTFCTIYLEGIVGTNHQLAKLGINNGQIKEWITLLKTNNTQLLNVSFINPMDNFWLSYGSYLEEITLVGGLIAKGAYYKDSGIFQYSPIRGLSLTSALLAEEILYQAEINNLIKILYLANGNQTKLAGEIILTIFQQNLLAVLAIVNENDNTKTAYGLVLDGELIFKNLISKYTIAGLFYEGNTLKSYQKDKIIYKTPIHEHISNHIYSNNQSLYYLDLDIVYQATPFSPFLKLILSHTQGITTNTYRLGLRYQAPVLSGNLTIEAGYGTMLGIISKDEKGIELCINLSFLF
jgi:hypothetical protein